MRKAFKYRLYPTKKQTALLEDQLGEGCCLYNAALEERREAYRAQKKSLNYYDQASQLKEIRAAGFCCLANFSACQDVLRRVDKTFRAFFARVKRGEKAGYPRFKSASRFDSLTFPAYGDGCKVLDNGKLRIQGVGEIKVKCHRPVQGQIKTVTLKRDSGRWYVCFSVEYEGVPLPPSRQEVGIDVGLESFATLSDGTQIDNPRHYREAQAKLRRAQRRVARRKRGGKNRGKAVREFQRAHTKVRNQRADFQHKLARSLVNRFGLICVEALSIKGLAGGMLAKSVMDAGWASFIEKLAYKAEEAGRKLVKVNPRGTSQTCSGCGLKVEKGLSHRWHSCPNCGTELHRDHNSALNILRLGRSRLGLTWSVTTCVPNEAAAL
jgi:putative transposase